VRETVIREPGAGVGQVELTDDEVRETVIRERGAGDDLEGFVGVRW